MCSTLFFNNNLDSECYGIKYVAVKNSAWVNVIERSY